MTYNLRAQIDAAVLRAQREAAPFTPSHADIAMRLAPVVNELLALGREQAEAALRNCGHIPGTWAVHVLAECKSAWSLEPPAPRRWTPSPKTIDGYNVEFLGARPPRAGEDY